jgi:hypothetical protein
MDRPDWRPLARAQADVIARRQLLALGYTRHYVRRQLDAERWVERTSRVVSTVTGPPTWQQRVWTASLHAGGSAIAGGLTALEWHGLKGWHRDEITVLVDDELAFEPLAGVRFFRTRRPLAEMRSRGHDLPLCRVEAAALLFAGYERSTRTALGLLAAVVQQRISAADALLAQLDTMRPLRRSRLLNSTLLDIGGGAQSMAELDVGRLCRRAGLPPPRRQTRRRDATGRLRFTDCEWLLRDGTVLILEIDGSFHMDVEHWEDDLARQRRLSGSGRLIVRCTARELRDDPDVVLSDLKMHGLCA